MLKQTIAIIVVAATIATSCSTGKKTTDATATTAPTGNQNGVRVQKVNTTIPPTNTQKTEVLYDK